MTEIKTYRIKTTSWVLWIFTLFIIVFPGAALGHEYLPNSEAFDIFYVIALFVLAGVLQQFISKGEVIVNLTDNYISINWVKQYIFHRRPDKQIHFSEIESYKIQPDRNFDLFKLTLKNGEEIRLWKSHVILTPNDDFDKLVSEFPTAINQFNQQKQIQTIELNHEAPKKKQEVKEEKNIYQSQAAPVFAILAVLMIALAITIVVVNPTGKTRNPFLLFSPLAGAIFFLTQFFRYRNKTN